MSVHEITEKNYDELVAKNMGTVIIDFGAEYCAPCRALAPIMERVAGEHAEVLVGTVDIESSPSLAAKFGVRSVPSVVAIRDGKATGRLAGRISKEDILKLIKE